MSRFNVALSLLAAGFLAASAAAIAEDAEGHHKHHGDWSPQQFAAMHKEMCTDRYAHHVGDLAYLEAKLSLTDAQRPLFEAWKNALLATAKSGEDACLAHTPDFSHPPTILDREAMMHQRLQMRLAALDAEGPALQSFYQSLSPDQKMALDRGPMDGPGMHGGPHGDHGPHDEPDGDGSAPAVPPPPNG